jgi:hypothetical protein
MGSMKDLFSGKSAPGPGRLRETPDSNVQFYIQYFCYQGFFHKIFSLLSIFVLGVHLPCGASDCLPT